MGAAQFPHFVFFPAGGGKGGGSGPSIAWLLAPLATIILLPVILTVGTCTSNPSPPPPPPKRCFDMGKVTVVGGCNHYGTCGVLLDNGLKCEARMPVVGQVHSCEVKCKESKP